MVRIIIAAALMLISAGAYAQFNKCGFGFCPGTFGNGFPPSGGGIPPLTNLRITNTGDFRITSTGDNRAVTP